MPDIAMCKGLDCKKREICYRAMAEPSGVEQSWSIERHPCCDDYKYFLPMRGKKKEEKP